jgi:tetratricopeptide (TPR) repeat protein
MAKCIDLTVEGNSTMTHQLIPQIEHDQSIHGFHYSVAQVQYKLGKYEEAIKHFTLSIQKKEHIFESTYQKAVCLMNTENIQEALDLFKNALEMEAVRILFCYLSNSPRQLNRK